MAAAAKEEADAQVTAAAAAAKVLAEQRAVVASRQVQIVALQAKIKTATEAGEYGQLAGLAAEIQALQVTTPASSRQLETPPRKDPRLSRVPPALSETPRRKIKNARRP